MAGTPIPPKLVRLSAGAAAPAHASAPAPSTLFSARVNKALLPPPAIRPFSAALTAAPVAAPADIPAAPVAAPEADIPTAPVSPAGDADAAPLVDAMPPPGECEVPIGEFGSVRLIDVMPRLVVKGDLGPEAAIVQAARVSYGAGTKTISSDEALLRYLLRSSHMTPFEMIELKFRVRAPIFTARQWFRHRSGSFNEESARYSELRTDFYAPDHLSAQASANRQGSGAPLAADAAATVWARMEAAYEMVRESYEAALRAGVSREIARIILPVGVYTTFYWKTNLRNLLGFLTLRMDPAAQGDIRSYADAIYHLLGLYCPIARTAFNDYVLKAETFSALEIVGLQTGSLPPGASARERAEFAKKLARIGLRHEGSDLRRV
jgi:thymidylate synthase (FAD)